VVNRPDRRPTFENVPVVASEDFPTAHPAQPTVEIQTAMSVEPAEAPVCWLAPVSDRFARTPSRRSRKGP